MPTPLRDRWTKNGKRAVRVQTPVYFTRDEAATALAALFPGQPVRRGVNTLQKGLSTAAQARLDAIGEGDVAARRKYHKRLAGEAEERLVAGYTAALDQHPGWFKHDGYTRHDAFTYFTLDEAATALALLHEDRPGRVGRITAQHGLYEAARRRVLDSPYRRRKLTKDEVGFWRQVLLDHGMFEQG